jgi:hypothetical protein
MTLTLVFITIPIVVVWVMATFDVARDKDMRLDARGLWILAFTFVWPTMLLWILVRRPGSRLGTLRKQSIGPRAVLVSSALEHESGLIDDEQMNEIKQQLRLHKAN